MRFGQGSQEWRHTPVVRATEKRSQEDCLGRPSCLRCQNKTISGEIKWLDLGSQYPGGAKATQGSQGQTEGREEVTVVGAAGINCKLNSRMYVQMLPSTTKGERAHCPQGRDVCWWPGGLLPVDIVVQPGWLTTPHTRTRPPEGRGWGWADATPLMSFPPSWVFLIIKISGLRRTSDIFWSPPGKHSHRPHPKAAGLGGFTRARWVWVRNGGLRRGWFENVSYTGKQK